MNKIIINGNLVDNIKVMTSNDGKLSAFGKIGVYNGKAKDGSQRPSMFFDLVVFGRDAEILRDNTSKGSPILVSGRLEEETTISQTNGQTYVNKRIVCDSVNLLVKPAVQQTQAQVVQPQAQYQTQTQYAQPVQQTPYSQSQYTNQPVQQVDPFMQM